MYFGLYNMLRMPQSLLFGWCPVQVLACDAAGEPQLSPYGCGMLERIYVQHLFNLVHASPAGMAV